MIVNINTDICVKNKLPPNQYTILYLLLEKLYGSLDMLIKNFNFVEDLNNLKQLKYIIDYDLTKSSEEFTIDRKKILELLGFEDSAFYGLLARYPIKVFTKGGGVRYLAPVSINAFKTKQLKKKYEKIVEKDKGLHKHILRCLDAQLWIMKKGGNLQYMQNLETWLNQRTWETYEHLLEMSNIKNSKDKYGEKLI